MKKVFFKTFGCRTNIYDTALMAENLKEFEQTTNEREADIVVINSCTVTNSADISVKNYINKVSKSGKRVYLTGCKVPTIDDSNLRLLEVDGVFDHSFKEQIDRVLQKDGFFIKRGEQNHIDSTIIQDLKGRTRAFIKIQEGCNFECSYCIIPKARGASRSIKESTILKQIEVLAQKGFSEVVLTGTNVGSYGLDSGSNLEKLIVKIANIDGIKRVRLGSIEPSQVPLLGDVVDAPFFNKHLHIALQHTSDEMLKIMNRRNRFDSDLKLFFNLKKRGFTLGTDFILGHPGESDEVWDEAVENFKKLPLTHIHTFIYSQREGTPSSLLDGAPPFKSAKIRKNELESIVAKNNYEFRKSMPKLRVLAERGRDGIYNGYDQFFNKIEIRSKVDIKRKWLDIKKYKVEYEKNSTVLE